LETRINNRNEFIRYIFKFFKVEYDESISRDYDRALSVQYPIDWDGLYLHVVKTTEKRILPMPKYFVDKLAQFKKRNEISVAGEGCIIRVILDDGRYYDFTVVSFNQETTLNRIKQRFQYKDEEQRIHTKIKKIVQYPKETTLIGDKAHFNVSIPNAADLSKEELEEKIAQKEEELTRQIKVLFVRKTTNEEIRK